MAGLEAFLVTPVERQLCLDRMARGLERFRSTSEQLGARQRPDL